MTTRSNRSPAGYEWLTRGIRVGFAHPKPIYRAAALLMVISLIPALFTLPIQLHMTATDAPPSLETFGWLEACSIVVGLLIVPVNAGFLQVIHAVERGLPTRARDIFNPYRNGEAWRLIGYGAVYMLITLVVVGIVIAIVMATAGSNLVQWYGDVLQAQASHAQPPPLPSGFGIGMALMMLAFIPLMGFYAVAFGQVALNRRPVFGALRDGVAGASRNLLPLFVLAVCIFVAYLVTVVVLTVTVLLVVLLTVLVALLAKPLAVGLLIVLLVPLVIAFMLVLITAIYGVVYHVWRDVCGDDAVPPPVPTTAFAA